MLDFPLLGNPVRVSGQKGKRILRITLVFCQMKRHPPNRVPDRIAAFQIRRRPAPGLGDGGMNMRVQLIPQFRENRPGQILQAPHRRRSFRQRLPLRIRRFRYRYRGSILQIRVVAKRREKPLRHSAPEHERWRQRLMQEPRRQHFQTARGRGGESLRQPRGRRRAEFRFSLLVRLHK